MGLKKTFQFDGGGEPYSPLVQFKKEDGGSALNASFTPEGEDDGTGLWINLISWDESGVHADASLMAGKRVRITLEVIDDQPESEGPYPCPPDQKALSMGCKVDPACSVCKTFPDGRKYTEIGKVTFFSTSVVPAPKCTNCGTEMTSHSDNDWHCRNVSCPLHLHPVHTGVFPIRKA